MDTLHPDETPSPAGKAYYGETATTNNQQSCAGQQATPRERAEKAVEYHRREMQRNARAFFFLSKYPEFDEFVQLVRENAISFL